MPFLGARIAGDVVERALGDDRSIVAPIAGRAREAVALLDEQPRVVLAVARTHLHERERAAQLLAVHDELQRAFGDLRNRVIAFDQLVRAVIPNNDFARAVVPGRDLSFEPGVIERVVFDPHREPFVGGIERRPFGHRPRLERSAGLEAEIEMQVRCSVHLDDEPLRAALAGALLG